MCECVNACVRACVRACMCVCVFACVRQLNGTGIAFRNLENTTSCIVLNLSKTNDQISGAARKERVTVQ